MVRSAKPKMPHLAALKMRCCLMLRTTELVEVASRTMGNGDSIFTVQALV
jgi:hypothetical protein